MYIIRRHGEAYIHMECSICVQMCHQLNSTFRVPKIIPAEACGDQIYIMGESMYTSSTKLLLDYLPWLKLRKHGTRCLSIIWKKVAAPPVIGIPLLCPVMVDWWQLVEWVLTKNSPQLFTCTTQPLTHGRSLATCGHHDIGVLQLSSLIS